MTMKRCNMCAVTIRKEIPGFPGYTISTVGEVFSSYSNRLLVPSKNNRGYLNVRIKREDGKIVTVGVHRLLCICFIPTDKDISRLVVNHKDGNKENNSLENLEWTTYQGNTRHAGELGLTSKCRPILVIVPNTWEITEFSSILDCANALGISKDKVSYRVKSKGSVIYPEGLLYLYKKDKDQFFKNILKKDYLSDKFGLSKKIQMRDIVNNKVLLFNKISDLANHLNIPLPTLSTWLKQKGQPVLPGFIQIKLLSDNTPWREVSDIYLELAHFTKTKPIFVKSKNGEVKIFTSAVECCKSLNITPTCLSYRLKSNGDCFFSDSNSYAYYTIAKSKGLTNQ